MNSLLRDLRQPFNAAEALAIEDLIQAIDELRAKTEDLSEAEWREGLERLSHFRLRSSNTLSRGDLRAWKDANDFISEKALVQSHPNIQDVFQINSILTSGTPEGTIRTQDIFLGPWRAADPSDLSKLMQIYTSEILSPLESPHILVRAALAHYWLVSIHPFVNGNGRTSVLVSDWIFSTHGYLPQSFATQLDAVVGHLPERKTRSTPARAVAKILINVKRSYELMMPSQPSLEDIDGPLLTPRATIT